MVPETDWAYKSAAYRGGPQRPGKSLLHHRQNGAQLPTRVLIVDDHEIVRQGIRALLERTRPDWQVCGEATNGQEAIITVQDRNPDVVVLDITMPVMNGLQAATQISRLGLPCRILIFTMHESERLIEEVRASGAHGCVLKSQASRDLIVAIEKLLAGGTFWSRQGPSQNDTDVRRGGVSPL